MSITITEVRNAASLQSDNLRMDVEINHPQHGWIPYAVDPSDTDMTIDNDEVMALIGADFAAYVPPTQEELDVAFAAAVRADRDRRLTDVDAVAGNALRWAALDAETQAAWAGKDRYYALWANERARGVCFVPTFRMYLFAALSFIYFSNPLCPEGGLSDSQVGSRPSTVHQSSTIRSRTAGTHNSCMN